MGNELLPVGSIVLLKNSTKKLMIIGVKQMDEKNPGKIYDYIGVPYPQGFLDMEMTFLFCNDDINDVFFMGYDNEENQKFHERLDRFFNCDYEVKHV